MPAPREPHTGPANSSSRAMLLVMLAIIVLAFAAFLILRPNPGSGGAESPSGKPTAPASR